MTDNKMIDEILIYKVEECDYENLIYVEIKFGDNVVYATSLPNGKIEMKIKTQTQDIISVVSEFEYAIHKENGEITVFLLPKNEIK